MEKLICAVILTISGIIDPIKLFVGADKKKVVENAEKYFKECVHEISKNISDEEIETALNDRYLEYGKYEVIITWPDYEFV